MNFRVQTYKGNSVLTYYAGIITQYGQGQGSYFILDDTYSLVATVKAGNHEFGDLHEFAITDADTAIITTYTTQPVDLSEFNISGPGWISNCGFQENDIATGEVRNTVRVG
jgi:Arylsulfotransferase (ASST)